MSKRKRFHPGWQTVGVGVMGGFMSALALFAVADDEPVPVPVEVTVEHVESPPQVHVEIAEAASVTKQQAQVEKQIGRMMSEGFSR